MAEKRRNVFPWLLLGAGVLLFLAGLASILLNGQSQAARTPTPASVEQVKRVSLQDARKAFDTQAAVFLDVRSSTSYAAAHIPRALSIPINELPDRINELDPGTWIIPY